MKNETLVIDNEQEIIMIWNCITEPGDRFLASINAHMVITTILKRLIESKEFVNPEFSNLLVEMMPCYEGIAIANKSLSGYHGSAIKMLQAISDSLDLANKSKKLFALAGFSSLSIHFNIDQEFFSEDTEVLSDIDFFVDSVTSFGYPVTMSYDLVA